MPSPNSGTRNDVTIAIRPTRFPWFDYSRYTFSLGLDLGSDAYLSGHSASEYDPSEKRILVKSGLASQAQTAYAKIEAILEAAGYGPNDVVRVVEYVTTRGMDSYREAEQVRMEVLGDGPTVCTVCVNGLLRPDALIEIEVVARKEKAGGKKVDGIIYLPSLLPLDEQGQIVGPGDLVAQLNAVYDRASRLLDSVGLTLSNVAKTVDYLTPAALADYKLTGRVRRERLGPVYPGATGIIMARLKQPEALIQVDLMASRHPLEAVNPGWERYRKLTYSPAVKAGNVLFMSGQAALDPATEQAVHPGDVAAQAAYTYGNILAVLEAAGGSAENLIKTIEYVTPDGLARYRETAAVRSRLLKEPFPASTGIVCEKLLRPEFMIEIDPMAVL
jgi:enamine deaminase RidA (YjgF/YER057c/UK114 family)